MTLHTHIQNTGGVSTAHPAYRITYWLKNLLKTTYGWTVIGSSDGTSWNMSGTDLIIGYSVMNFNSSNRWIVLESPHASPSDRVQILIGNAPWIGNVTAVSIGIAFDGFTASSTAQPTGGIITPVNGVGFGLNSAGSIASADIRVHFVYDDVTYEWRFMANASSNQFSDDAM